MPKKYIVIEDTPHGPKVTDHPSKKAAKDHGTSLRRAGKTAFMHSHEHAQEFGLDPRTKKEAALQKLGGAFDESKHARDEAGKFN